VTLHLPSLNVCIATAPLREVYSTLCTVHFCISGNTTQHCKCNLTLARVRITIFVVEKQ